MFPNASQGKGCETESDSSSSDSSDAETVPGDLPQHAPPAEEEPKVGGDVGDTIHNKEPEPKAPDADLPPTMPAAPVQGSGDVHGSAQGSDSSTTSSSSDEESNDVRASADGGKHGGDSQVSPNAEVKERSVNTPVAPVPLPPTTENSTDSSGLAGQGSLVGLWPQEKHGGADGGDTTAAKPKPPSSSSSSSSSSSTSSSGSSASSTTSSSGKRLRKAAFFAGVRAELQFLPGYWEWIHEVNHDKTAEEVLSQQLFSGEMVGCKSTPPLKRFCTAHLEADLQKKKVNKSKTKAKEAGVRVRKVTAKSKAKAKGRPKAEKSGASLPEASGGPDGVEEPGEGRDKQKAEEPPQVPARCCNGKTKPKLSALTKACMLRGKSVSMQFRKVRVSQQLTHQLWPLLPPRFHRRQACQCTEMFV